MANLKLYFSYNTFKRGSENYFSQQRLISLIEYSEHLLLVCDWDLSTFLFLNLKDFKNITKISVSFDSHNWRV